MVAHLVAVSTHLPVWGTEAARVAGPDEDALTLAVAAGRAAIAAARGVPVERVVLVTRDLPLLEGGSTAVLLAGLDLPATTMASEVLGGAAAALDQLGDARPGTLVIGADVTSGAGAGAAVAGGSGLGVTPLARHDASLPTHVRDASGVVSEYDDARLLRDRGVLAGIAALGLSDAPDAVAGLGRKEAAAVVKGAPALPTTGASAPFFALAAGSRVLVAVDQAAVSAASLDGAATVVMHAPVARPLPKRRPGAPVDLAIALPAYERAFSAKLGFKAGRCTACGTLALPPRHRCLTCGDESGQELVPLPRDGEVYTAVTIHVPVPGLAVPYSLAIVEMGTTGVRALVHVTDDEPGAIAIGDRGEMLFRLVAVRSGVRDYGYAFAPARVPVEVAA